MYCTQAGPWFRYRLHTSVVTAWLQQLVNIRSGTVASPSLPSHLLSLSQYSHTLTLPSWLRSKAQCCTYLAVFQFFCLFSCYFSAQELKWNQHGHRSSALCEVTRGSFLLFRAGCYRRVPVDQCQHDGSGTRAQANHLQPGPSEQALHPGKTTEPLTSSVCFNMHVNVEFLFLFQSSVVLLQGSDPWTEQALLLHHHQLQEKWTRAKGVKHFCKSIDICLRGV